MASFKEIQKLLKEDTVDELSPFQKKLEKAQEIAIDVENGEPLSAEDKQFCKKNMTTGKPDDYLSLLCKFAIYRDKAIAGRLGGNMREAQAWEKEAEKVYNELPKEWKW